MNFTVKRFNPVNITAFVRIDGQYVAICSKIIANLKQKNYSKKYHIPLEDLHGPMAGKH
jgi:hypothetical protein